MDFIEKALKVAELRRACTSAEILAQYRYLDRPIWLVDRTQLDRRVFTSIPLNEWGDDSLYENISTDEIVVKPFMGDIELTCDEAWAIASELMQSKP